MIRLTKDIWNKLKIEDIVYAEYAEGGAMGNTGGLIICIIETNDLVYYETNVYDNTKLYKAARLKINSHSNGSFNKNKKSAILFDYHYGGFGNHTFLNINFKIGRTENALLFKKGEDSFEVRCSNPGVFEYIVGSIKLKTNENFIKNLNTQLEPLGINKIESPLDKMKKEADKLEANSKVIDSHRDFVKKKYGDKLKDLVKIIDKHDPMGLIDIICPKGEYETEAIGIIIQLKENQNIDDIQHIVYKEFKRIYGSKSAGPKNKYIALARDIHKWLSLGGLSQIN